MNKYEVILNGSNYLIAVDAVQKKMGFYVTRYIEASNPDQAERLAIELVMNDEHLNEMVKNNSDDLPTVVLEEMYEIKSFDGLETLKPGFGFYDENE